MPGRNPLMTDGKTIRLDYHGMMSGFIGSRRGITPAEIEGLLPLASTAALNLDARRKSGEWGFFNLPYDSGMISQVIREAETRYGKFEDFVVTGIGGSALGGLALFHALTNPLHNLLSPEQRNGRPRVFFLDNIDPVTFRSITDNINPERTLFNVVTKSGSTTETISHFLAIRRMLGENLGAESVKDHIIITTGESGSRLRILAEENNYPLLTIPDNIAGRFSVFSPVGLFPAAMAGIDIESLLAGARYADERCRTPVLHENPAYMAGALHYLADTEKGLNIAVIMPYCDALLQAAHWFRQLWGESLGKTRTVAGETVNSGQTPVVSPGAADQHSQLQLYMEGPFNKMITFLTVEKHGAVVPLPGVTEEEFACLGGHDLGELLNVEAEATRLALIGAGRSNMNLVLPEITPFIIGQLLFMLEVQAAFTGGLYGVNPMIQPGVEASKINVYRMLGKKGYSSPEAGDGKQADAGIFII